MITSAIPTGRAKDTVRASNAMHTATGSEKRSMSLPFVFKSSKQTIDSIGVQCFVSTIYIF